MIHELRILPPLAIARFGTAPTPMDNYDAVVDPANPLGYRRLRPAETLEVDVGSGEIARTFVPDELAFTEGGKVRPVAPFLEVWALTGDEQLTGGGQLEPLTLDLLAAQGAAVGDVSWQVQVANLKVFRRTRAEDDKVQADTGAFSDHARRALTGACPNFLQGKTIGLGHAQFIKPTAGHPEIRLRFTPAGGSIYGSSRQPPGDPDEISDIVYDAQRGTWAGYFDPRRDPRNTAPPQIYAGEAVPDPDNPNLRRWVSDGYLDDGCDGIVRVTLALGGRTLGSFARVGSGPPTYAPDAVPIRTVADELEQALFGPEVAPADATLERAEEIVRRAFETVRLMNTGVANAQTTFWAGGGEIMDPSLVDVVALENLHRSLLVALRSGTVPWFADVLREPEEAADLTVGGRRKMPAMMRGADAFALTLTRRQIDLFRALARRPLFGEDQA